MKKTFLVVYAGNVESYDNVTITVVVLAEDQDAALLRASIDANAEFDEQYDIDPDELADAIESGDMNTSVIEVKDVAVMINIGDEY